MAILMWRSLSTITVSFVLLLAIACNSRKEIDRVRDNEKVLTKYQSDKLDSLFRSYEKNTGNEIVLVTTPDYGSDTSLLRFAGTIANQIGAGKRNKNNSVVIAFCNAKHQVSIAMGVAAETAFSNYAKQVIVGVMIPRFNEGGAFAGLWDGSRAIVEYLERPENRIK